MHWWKIITKIIVEYWHHIHILVFVMNWYLYAEQFSSTPLSPTTKDACDLSKATTQLLVVDVACD